MQISSEKGKLFEQSLHTGFPQLGHSLVEVCELHREQILFFINIISALKAKNISHNLNFLINYILEKSDVFNSDRDDIA